MDRLVVVIVEPTYLRNVETGRFAARIRPLGLTAYGKDREEASARLRRMFAGAVEARRIRGTLVKWLDRSGLEWHWEDEYDSDLPIEYVGVAQRESVKSPSQGSSNNWIPEFPLLIAA